ncbi:MAG: prolipoprotein diacylglyceryl transferase family protein [Cyclobacteriaceae bacterium]
MENPVAGYFIWRGGPEILSFGGFALRWSAVLFVLAFLISRQILLYLYKKEGKPLNAVSYLCIYLVVAALVGARLGHLIFYQRGAILSKEWSIIFPFAFEPGFHLLGASEFSEHGAVFGLLIFLWFYGRKNPLHQRYFQLLDRVALVCVLSGSFLLLASFFNSGIQGKPTTSDLGTIYVSPVERGLTKVPCCIMRSPDGQNPLERVEIRKDPAPPKDEKTQKSVIVYLFFKPGASERLVNEFLMGDVKAFLYEMSLFVHEPGDQPLHYRIFLEKNGNYIARIQTKGISRYPVQIFEAVSSVVILIFLWWWYGTKVKHPGRLFAFSMILFWGLHIGYGFFRETQGSVETGFNIVFVLMGLTVLFVSYRKSTLTTVDSSAMPEKTLYKKD